MRHASIALTLDKRCPLCRADYNRFRPGLDFGRVAAELSAGDIQRADASAMIRDADVRTFRGRCAILAEMSNRKRAEWDANHGPGRCFSDVWAPIIARAREHGPASADDRDWNLRELVAGLILDDEEDAADDESIEVDATFDVGMFDAVPMFVDDGQATTCIAA